jgi:hypothetical protein
VVPMVVPTHVSGVCQNFGAPPSPHPTNHSAQAAVMPVRWGVLGCGATVRECDNVPEADSAVAQLRQT